MKKLHPELKRLEAEVSSIADFSGMPKAKIGEKAISSVIDAECGSKNANKKVVDALKNIGEAVKSTDLSKEEPAKVETPKTPGDAIKKMGETAVKNMEKLKEVVSPTKKPAEPAEPKPAAPEPSKEDTSEISQLMWYLSF